MMKAIRRSVEPRWWTLGAICGATFILLVDVTIVQVALPTIQRRLGAGFTDLQWVIDGYALTLAAFILTCGSLADRYGRKLVFVGGVLKNCNVTVHLSDYASAEQAQNFLTQQIAESEKSLSTCDAIDHATQGIKAVPQMIAIAQRPFDFAVAFFTSMTASIAPPGAGGMIAAGGKLTSGLPKAAGKPKEALAEGEIELGSETEVAERLVDRIPESVRNTPAYKFVVTESKSFLPSVVDGLGESNGSLHLFNIVTKLAGDIAAYANEQLFAQYCEKFEGPFTATMEAHFYAKQQPDGRIPEWWSFTTSIAGNMVLRYPKSAAGKRVALSGEIEGGATRFTYKENVFDGDLFGKMAKGGVVHLIDVPPAATDDANARDELNDDLLDTVHLAGARFDRMLKRLAG